MLLGMRKARRETMTPGDRTGEPEFLERWPELGITQLDRLQPELGRASREFRHGHRVETPRHHGLLDPTALHPIRSVGRNRRRVSRAFLRANANAQYRGGSERLE